ncbi:hypothetical protein OG590_34615 [Streptomyces goshikiensis]|uniref:hypothetical protein n=1 Tax=Streptomyces goshikiensis TaxID=1942 RepID=UPI0033C19E44|nr:hypothetical protein OG590_34615 [Streptomyces goshikiensis]
MSIGISSAASGAEPGAAGPVARADPDSCADGDADAPDRSGAEVAVVLEEGVTGGGTTAAPGRWR